ncbi:hypothetical protein LINPERPRIM_LOCUS11568 [Linum perenne]
MAPTFLSFLLISLSLTTIPSSSASPNSQLIIQQCHNSITPAACIECQNSQATVVCIQCLNSHPAQTQRPNIDEAGLAAVLLKCIWTHSSYLAANMTDLIHMPPSNAAVSALKPIFKACRRKFSHMLKELSDAASYLNKGDYDNANLSVKKLTDHQLECEEVTRGHEKEIGQPQIFYDMRLNDHLSEAFMWIVERL